MSEGSKQHSPTRFVLRSVGRVELVLADPAEAPSQGDEGAPNAWLDFDPDVYDAARDLQIGDRIVVITWLHLARREVLRTFPRDWVDALHIGVFKQRAPDRPNPIGLHPVEVRAIAGSRVQVNKLEAVNGTPILDVKPEI